VKLALFGATGFSGRVVLEEALARGHEVAALVRDPATLDLRDERLEVRRGDALVRADVEACLHEADAVVHCLGVGGKGNGTPTTLVSDSVELVLEAMEAKSVRRIVCMSNVGAGGSGYWLVNRVIVPLFVRWLPPLVEDKDRMEALLRASSAEWISARFPNIRPGPARPIKTSPDGKGISMNITTSSVAAFMLDQLDDDTFVRATPSVSN
jgi:putative NADH-flavin reductase